VRKLIWCCCAAGVLAAGGYLSLVYHVCRHPDTPMSQAVLGAARAVVSMQPLNGLVSMAVHSTKSEMPHETAGSAEECVPADPQPIDIEADKKIEEGEMVQQPGDPIDEAAPIVIPEEEPPQNGQMVQAVPAPVDVNGVPVQGMPPNGCPIFMPYCQDDADQPATPPIMPCAGEEEDKPAKQDDKKSQASSEESEQNVFNAWQKLFESGQKNESKDVEELPPPVEEESSDEPKCQEDPHRHENYSGCPHVTCPYTGKTYPSCEPPKSAGKEESQEPVEMPKPHDKKSHSGKGCKIKDECPRTQGVDTMEYRPSDGGLNEYGPGPLH
jgi:hypothetical protein